MAPFIICLCTSMSDPDRNSNSTKRQANLEEWLQLPDSYDKGDREGDPGNKLDELPDAQNDDTQTRPEPKSIDKEGILTLFPAQERSEDVSSGADEATESEIEPSDADDGKPADEPRIIDDDAVVEMENLLNREFGDTLAGANALTLPLGLLLILLAVLAWYMDPFLQALGLGQIPREQVLVPLISSVLLALGGVHLVFYWLIHRISNAVKSRELDRLIEDRRINRMCIHLDCTEGVLIDNDDGVYESEGDEFESGMAGEREGRIELIWRCSLFDVDVEGIPICAVCDRYEYRRDKSQDSYLS
jgi:hypothetical protein